MYYANLETSGTFVKECYRIVYKLLSIQHWQIRVYLLVKYCHPVPIIELESTRVRMGDLFLSMAVLRLFDFLGFSN